ncbi:MAG: hypothetical protein ACE5R4_13170 [Armatimonadota bacterium]
MVRQCCLCNAIYAGKNSDGEEMWVSHPRPIRGSHGICPVCLPAEVERIIRMAEEVGLQVPEASAQRL